MIKPKNIKRIIRLLIYVLIGAIVGYLYYKFYGCTTNCAITSNPVKTMMYTSVMGVLLSIATEK